ncbi:DUF2948 family protein [Tepidamorphus gemmatus]|uniref:DUF2948 family protein n=1 Tax=Tepidamorphus gemmatus TaxID=747076 RepID=A0A4R3LYI1_9HYPH|nr:DUF2948 family protein [Tepidamorphus gemmatus]TCT03815.1 DUF2948 family protein [Tepidamorphus gemmatus]
MSTLKLFALDREDLEIVSAHLQDAVARIGDIAWLPREKRFAMVMNRFDWAAGEIEPGLYRRNRTALSFDRVTTVRRKGVETTDPDRVLNLLAIRFEEVDPPAGMIELLFSGGAAIRLEVECIEARLSDLGPAWATPSMPRHAVEDDGAGATSGPGASA